MDEKRHLYQLARGWRSNDLPVACIYLNVKECVEVGDDDMLVLHLAPHVLDGVDGSFVVRLWTAVERQLLQPHAAHLKQSVEHEPGQLHRLQL